MNSINDTTSTQTETTTAPAIQPDAPATKPAAKAKAPKAPKVEKANKPATAGKPAKAPKSEADGEATDRLPTSLKELKETKGGLVASLILAGKDKDGIAKELKAAFKLSEAQAVKITRRITGRVRLYQRIFELVTVKK